MITEQRSEGLRQIAAQTGSTLYMVLLAVYSTLLSKYSGQEDIVIGSPIAGRAHADVQPIIGMFVNTLAMRNYPAGEKSFTAYVQEVKEHALKAYENQDYPFEELVEKIHVNRDMSRNPLFDTMFVLQNLEQEDRRINGLQFQPYRTKYTVSKFDLTFIAVESGPEITCTMEYATALYKPETIKRMSEHLIQLIDAIIMQPEAKLSTLEMITAKEKKQILEVFNDTAVEYSRDKTIHQLFEERAEQTPNHIAIVFETRELTYSEVNERANQLARTIRAEGGTEEQLIGIMTERTPEMVIGILAILKAGGAYLPIDPEYPEERIRYILNDSGAQTLLLQEHLHDRISFKGKIIKLDDERAYNEDGSNLGLSIGANQLAYVIYTSGTTGKPKSDMLPLK
ncbi:condensation domain-containing protein [Paenibacillus thiaminolyticus]|uniref:non-ribosomal peptide synthetase n=1 Tax=Paenibacillus thiaminolyticus TaxID=49283 RepID=UPI0035A6211D